MIHDYIKFLKVVLIRYYLRIIQCEQTLGIPRKIIQVKKKYIETTNHEDRKEFQTNECT